MNGMLVPFADLKHRAIMTAEMIRAHPAFFHWHSIQNQLFSYVSALLSKEWRVIHTRGTETFITSDCPVFPARLWNGVIGWGYGMLNPDATIFFPLSPRTLFFAIPRGQSWVFTLSDKEVRMFNRAIAWNAYEEIYAPEFRTQYKELAGEISKASLFEYFRR
jgi:hypothetical protein